MDLGKIGYRVAVDDAAYLEQLQSLEQNTAASSGRMAAMFSKVAGAVGLVSAAWKGWEEARKFSAEIANIRSIAGEFDTSKLRKEISSLNRILGSSAELANGVYFAYSAGVRGTERELAQFSGQIAQLAQTIGSGITPVMEAATTMMNAYGLGVQDTGKICDWFYTIAGNGKTTSDELAQSLKQIAATAAAAGVPIEQLGASLVTLTSSMPTNIAITSLAESIRSIMAPIEETRKLAESLGIELSMSAIKANGFGGVIEDIAQKTGGSGDLIGKLFPAESSHAVEALVTQLQALKDNIDGFDNSTGAAAGNAAANLADIDDVAKGLNSSMLDVGKAFGTLGYNILTMGGTLSPVLQGIVSLKSETFLLAARLIETTVDIMKFKKAFSGIGKAVVSLAVKGGYQTPEMLESSREKAQAAVQNAMSAKRIEVEKLITANKQFEIAKREALAAREIALEAKTALAMERTALARTKLQNDISRQFGGSVVDTAPQEARVTAAQKTYAASRSSLSEKTKETLSARKNAIAAESRVITANTAVNQANTAAKATNTVASGANTATTAAGVPVKGADAVAANVDGAAHGFLTIAMTACKTAAKGLWAVMATNPITTILVLVASLATAIMWLKDRAKQAQEEALQAAQNAADKTAAANDKASASYKRAAEEVKKSQQSQDRLQLLSGKPLNDAEMIEARQILNDLKTEYGEFGVTLDEQTKRLTISAGAWDQLKKKQLSAMSETTRKEYAAVRRAEIAGEENFQKAPYETKKSEIEKKYQAARSQLAMSQGRGFAIPASEFDKLKETRDKSLANLDATRKKDWQATDEYKDFQKKKHELKAREATLQTGTLPGAKDDDGEKQPQDQPDMQKEHAQNELIRQREILEAKNAAMQDNVLSKKEEINLAEMEYNAQLARAIELEKEAAKTGTDTAKNTALEARGKAGELYNSVTSLKKADRENRFAATQEFERTSAYNEIAKKNGGFIGKKGEYELNATDIRLQKNKIKELGNQSSQTRSTYGADSAEYMSARTEEAKAQSALYDLERRRRDLKREIAESERSSAMNALLAKAWEDGQLSNAERIAIKKQEIADQQQRVTEAQKEAAQATGEEAKRIANDAVNVAQAQLGKLTKDVNDMQPQNKAMVSFDATILSQLTGSNTAAERTALAAERTATATEQISKNTKTESNIAL